MDPGLGTTHNPYPGLRSFRPDEADVFFGRERQIADLMRRLDEVPLVAVAGASGCGKSSLVLAGLLKALQQRYADGDPVQWRSVVMRPGNDPIMQLARPLAAALSPDADHSRAQALAGRLRLGGTALAEAVRTARLPAHIRVLVVVDQFEEIFRYRRISDPEDCAALVKLLLHAARDPTAPVRVVLTMRSDALGFCADFRDLPEAVSRGQFLVPRLTREQRKQAIVGPARQCGCDVAPRLVQRLLNDVSEDFDDLPVMQHVLARTWRHWADTSDGTRPLDLEDYEAVGTSRHALSRHADEAYDSLPALGPVVERVFRALTERIGGPGSEVRRPLRFQELCAVVGAEAEAVGAVVERYRRADTVFLMPPDVPLTSDPPIDISHESLIRGWARLRGWAQAEAESARMLRRLVDAARLHARGQGALLTDPALQFALDWRARERPNATWAALYEPDVDEAMRFVDESRAARDAEVQARRRERRRRRSLLVGTASVLLLCLGAIGWTTYEGRAQERLRLQAEQDEAQRTRSRRLAQASDRARADRKPEAALLLAAAALRVQPTTEEAQESLRHALLQPELPTGGVRHGLQSTSAWQSSYDLAFAPDQAHLAVACGDASAWLWNNAQGAPDAAPLRSDGGASTSLAYNASGSRLAVGTHEGHVTVWDTQTRRPIARMRNPEEDRVSTVVFIDEGRRLAAGTRDGQVLLWDVAACETRGPSTPCPAVGNLPLPRPQTEAGLEVHSLAHSPDGRYLAVARQDGSLLLWDLMQSQWVPTPIRATAALKKVVFDPTGGATLAVASLDKTIRLWDATRPMVAPVELRQPSGVTAIAFDASGRRLVSGSNDGTLRVWDVGQRALVGFAFGAHDDAVFAVAFRQNGGTVASVGADSRLALWDVDFERWPARACELAGRDLAPEEWPKTLYDTPEANRNACGPSAAAVIASGRETAR